MTLRRCDADMTGPQVGCDDRPSLSGIRCERDQYFRRCRQSVNQMSKANLALR